MNEHKSFKVEEVEGVETPPRARVEDAETPAEKLGRKKDYLEGFLSQQPPEVSASEPGGALYEAVIEALKDIYDPEIPVNIYDLGLIYSIRISAENEVEIDMTLTAPGCPVAGEMPGWVENAVGAVEGVSGVEVSMTFDPPWTPDRMSEEAQVAVGWY